MSSRKFINPLFIPDEPLDT